MNIQEYLRMMWVLGMMMIAAPLSYGQQDAQYSQYMYNTVTVNPAYAGSREVLSVVGLHRNQWVGVNGAPKTNTLSVNFPVGYIKQIGLGFTVVNDVIGPSNETYFNIDFSYPIQVSRTGTLRFGLKAVGRFFNIDPGKLNLFDPGNSAIGKDAGYEFSPNVGVGAYYYTDRGYVGVSAPQLFERDYLNTDANNASVVLTKERVHYYLIGGYVFDITPDIKFKPAVLTKVVSGSPLQLDLSANFMFYERFIAGVAYRWSAALSALAGFQISKSIMLGFAYDRETTELGSLSFNGGSYEVLLRFEFGKAGLRRWTPRFF